MFVHIVVITALNRSISFNCIIDHFRVQLNMFLSQKDRIILFFCMKNKIIKIFIKELFDKNNK